MTDIQPWTPEDDELVRKALLSLRADVEQAPMADPADVRAQGDDRRRSRMLAWTAAAAAAVIAIGAVGYSVVSRDAVDVAPPATSSTAAPGSYLDQPGALPLAAEWQDAFGVESSIIVSDSDTSEDLVCAGALPADPVQSQTVRGEQSGFRGVQMRYAAGSPEAASATFEEVAETVRTCETVSTRRVDGPQGSVLWSYTSADDGSGWIVLARSGRHIAWLQVAGQGDSTAYDAEQVSEIARIAVERMERYGSSQIPSPTTPKQPPSSPSAEPTDAGPSAVDEEMPVVGSSPALASGMFVAASQWSSQALTGGAATRAGTLEFGGSAALHMCDPDTSSAGTFGLVGVTNIETGVFIGRQRVRVLESSQAASDYLSRLASGFSAGCSFPNGTNEVTPGEREGTFRIDTVFADGSPTLTTFVGVTEMTTDNAVATVVITEITDPSAGFDELDRLLDLAAQK